MVISRNA